MVVPNKQALDDGAATILLGGQLWPIPQLAFKQNRIIVPLILEIAQPLFKAAGDEDRRRALDNLADVMDEAMYDKLGRVIFIALGRAHPELTKQEFEELPMATMEMITALLTISRQTGLTAPASEAPGGAPSKMGEDLTTSTQEASQSSATH